MPTSEHINQTYFLAMNSLNPSLAPCFQLYNLQICLLYRTFCSLVSKSNTHTFRVSCYSKKTRILASLMVFKQIGCPINNYFCCLACKKLKHTMHFALISLTTSAAYMTSFNNIIYQTFILCCILSAKYFTGTFLLTF